MTLYHALFHIRGITGETRYGEVSHGWKKDVFPFVLVFASEGGAVKPRSRLDRGRILVEHKKERCQRRADGHREVRATMDEEKAVATISGFSDGKFKTECELLLSVPRPRGKADTKAYRRRSRQDLKLLSNDWLGARIEACFPIFDPTAACLGNVLFDIARARTG